MSGSRPSRKPSTVENPSPLMVRLDEESKLCLVQAAELRKISVSDYVRAVVVPQARREVRAAEEQVVAPTAEEQLSLWNALNDTPRLAPAQRRLGPVMRGES